jgi:hypothetical protein
MGDVDDEIRRAQQERSSFKVSTIIIDNPLMYIDDSKFKTLYTITNATNNYSNIGTSKPSTQINGYNDAHNILTHI